MHRMTQRPSSRALTRGPSFVQATLISVTVSWPSYVRITCKSWYYQQSCTVCFLHIQKDDGQGNQMSTRVPLNCTACGREISVDLPVRFAVTCSRAPWFSRCSGNGYVTFEEFAEWSRQMQPGDATERSLQRARVLFNRVEQSGCVARQNHSGVCFLNQSKQNTPLPG